MKDTVFICVASQAYLPQYRVLHKSIQTYSPAVDTLLYYTGTNTPDLPFKSISHWPTNYPNNALYRHCEYRPKAILDAFNMGYERVVLLGADTEFFSYPDECFRAFKEHDAFVTMYIHEPYEGDQSLYGNNLQVLENGQINADLIGFKKNDKTIAFLQWVSDQVSKYAVINGKEFVDQVWLSMCFSFLDNVKVIRHLGYNVAHYNLFQRGMHLVNDKWTFKDGSNLVLFHYSGHQKELEEKLSKHQNRHSAAGELLEFLRFYSSRI